jgi:hypothetical protein
MKLLYMWIVIVRNFYSMWREWNSTYSYVVVLDLSLFFKGCVLEQQSCPDFVKIKISRHIRILSRFRRHHRRRRPKMARTYAHMLTDICWVIGLNQYTFIFAKEKSIENMCTFCNISHSASLCFCKSLCFAWKYFLFEPLPERV